MRPRLLVPVVLLTAGDYLTWNFSADANQDLVALISGLMLPPLGIALILVLAVSAGRLLARLTRQARTR